MHLFHCRWDTDASFLVHAVDEAAAKAAAIEEVGSAPDKIRLFPPGLLGLRVYFDEDKDGNELVTIEPLPHVQELLGNLEDEPDEAPSLALVPSPPPPCKSEALDDKDRRIYCELAAGHPATQKHCAKNGAGGVLEW